MTNQIFQVIYKNECFMVDPSKLYNSSKKFSQMIDLIGPKFQNIQLKINYDQFSVRNICNFLKLCQNQQTDIENSEIIEICLIAKMFKADHIYSTCISFIQSNRDKNFSIPDDQFNDENDYLILECKNQSSIPHQINFDELEFDDSCEAFSNEKDNNKSNNAKEFHSICYQIVSDNKFLKCPKFYLKKDNKILFTAKVKNNHVYISEGENFHINEKNIENCTRITRKCEDYNIVNTNDQEFKIKYVRSKDNKASISVKFSHQGKKLSWKPKTVNNQACFNGEYNHIARPSKKNIILQNSVNDSTLIIRKMTKKSYEAECNPEIFPIVIFSIAISQIVGPLLI